MCLIANKCTCIFIFQAWLALAQQMQRHNIAYWRRVHWPDECRFVLCKSDGRVKVWRRRGERFHPDYSAMRSLRRGIGDGVGYGVPKLQIRPGHSQRKPQCSSLQGWDFGRTSGASLWQPCLSRSSHLHAWWGNVTHCQDFDGFPAPVCHGNTALAFPQPDLNPIEHVWDDIRRHLNKMDPRVQSLDELREAIHEVWRHGPQQYVRRLIHSMRRRVAACIVADGGSTHYWLL